MTDHRITQVPHPSDAGLMSAEQREGIMSPGMQGAQVAATSTAEITQAIRAWGSIVQVGRDAFHTIVARQKAPLVVHATGGLFRKNYQYLTSYKGLAFFACLSAPMDFPADAEIVLAKRIWVPD